MEEIWKKIDSYRNYEISNLGRVRNTDTGKIKTVLINTRSYPYVSLWCKQVGKNKMIHRLIAEAFIPNPENKPQVNHKNGNKFDYRIENLEWVTISENAIHAFATGLSFVPNKENFLVYNWKTEQFVKEFKTEEECANALSITSRGNINQCLNDLRDFEKSFVFIYKSRINDDFLNMKLTNAKLNNQSNCDRKIKVYTLDNVFYKEYSSQSEAVRELKLSAGNTSMCLSGLRNHHKGFKFEWSDRE